MHFRSLTDGIDTKTPAGRFFFHVSASLAQMDSESIVERTRAGLGAARKLGQIGGRKRRMNSERSKRRIDSSPAARSRATSQRIAAFRCPRFIDGYRRQQDHREQG